MDYGRIFNKKMIALLVAAALPLAAQANQSEVGGAPESVLRHGDALLVANVGAKLEPSAKDGDGYISLVRPGAETVKDMFEGKVRLDAPKGMGIHKGVLYVADIDRLVGIDLTRKEQVLELSFKEKGVGFLNDVAISDSGVLYVSATDAGSIFTVDLAADKPSIASLPVPALPGPNGLYFDATKRRLIVASFGTDKAPGELGVVDLGNNSYTAVPGVNGLFDGIALLDEQTVLTSDWAKFEPGAGVLKRVNLSTGEVSVVRRDLSGPADFTLWADGEFALPNMMGGSILIEHF
jgi:hypothetical protein